jgi:uncharacterized protein YbjT (DUF2867 family)
VIHLFGRAEAPVPRLIERLRQRGHGVAAAVSEPGEAATLVLGPGSDLGAEMELALGVLLGAWRRAPSARVLIVSRVGAHPDARSPQLRYLWRLEELVRGHAIPSLTLRLAPLIGAESPLWLKLRSRPRLPRDGRQLIQPVAEADVVDTLALALDGGARWNGWYEVAGPRVMSLAELAELARAAGPAPGRGAWEPSIAEIEEQRLCEPPIWMEAFGITPRPVAPPVQAGVA